MAKSKADQLKDAQEAHGKGQPLPTGVTFAPYNNPPYLFTEEYEKIQADRAGTGQFGGGEVVAPGPVDDAGGQE